FTLAGTAALYSNPNFVLGFSNTDRQAAARALLRSQLHLDGTHYQTRMPSGLHPAYIAFNDTLTSTEKRSITHEEFVKAALEDVFNVLTTQDCLDGGFSILIRCPGSHIAETISPEHVVVDLYVTPRELHEESEQIGGDVSVLVQAFSKNHQDRCSKLRSAIRHIINEKLQSITGNPKATMQWADYWRNIVQCYLIICEGWPSTVPFKNLSEASSALPEL
ncbi:hypothetical protein EV702DRAFT_928738, partial [Suillus placidus]